MSISRTIGRLLPRPVRCFSSSASVVEKIGRTDDILTLSERIGMGDSDGVVKKLLVRIKGSNRLSDVEIMSAAKSGLMFGYPEIAVSVLSSKNCMRMHTKGLFEIATLVSYTKSAGLANLLVSEVIRRIGDKDELHLMETHDLVRGVTCLPRLLLSCSASGGGISAQSTTSIVVSLKRAALELIRRIELRQVSPPSVVSLCEVYSGLPPFPIDPLLLQACYASLLENLRFKTLSPNDTARVLHAMTLSEIENVILSQLLVKHALSTLSTTAVGGMIDPRVNLRLLSSVATSKAYFPGSYVRMVTGLTFPKTTVQDISTTIAGMVNLLGSASICPASALRLISQALPHIPSFDVIDASSLLLLFCYTSTTTVLGKRECMIPTTAELESDEFGIFMESLEITEKSNSALPNHRLKKKRLLKRAEQRFEFLQAKGDVFSAAAGGVRDVQECQCLNQEGLEVEPDMVLGRVSKQCLALLREARVDILDDDVMESAMDILTGIVFIIPELSKDAYSVSTIDRVAELTGVCLSILAKAGRSTSRTDVDDIESSLANTVRNLGMAPVVSPFVTNSNFRISLVS